MFCGTMIGGSIYGTGYKLESLAVEDRLTAMKYWWLCEIAYCFASVGCKISVCIFLMRITIRPLHIWILYTVMAFTVIAGLVFMFLMLLQCRPLEYFWTKLAHDPTIIGKCMDMKIIVIMTYIYSAFAALCDFTVGILPIFLVRKLHMKRQTKIAVMGILGMACMYVLLSRVSVLPDQLTRDSIVLRPRLSSVSPSSQHSMTPTSSVCSLPSPNHTKPEEN